MRMNCNRELTIHGERFNKDSSFTGSIPMLTNTISHLIFYHHVVIFILLLITVLSLTPYPTRNNIDVECGFNRFIRQPFSLLHLRWQRSERIEYGEKMMTIFILSPTGRKCGHNTRKCNQFTEARFDREERRVFAEECRL